MSNTQVNFIVKEEGICVYRGDDPSSAILCEDQERAKEIIEELLFQGDPSLVNIEIGSIYPVPGIEFEEKVICDTCGMGDDSDCDVYKIEVCDFISITVAHLIERTAMTPFKKLTAYDEGVRSVATDHTEPIESTEIDKEEEQDASYDLYMEIKTLMDDFNEDFILRKIKEKFTIHRKP